MAKQTFSADELVARTSLYGDKVEKKELIMKAMEPALVFAFITTIVLYTWWLSILAFLYGFYVGWKDFVPAIVDMNYDLDSFNERNRFMNMTSQMMLNDSKTTFEVLEEAHDRSRGQLKLDLTDLLLRIYDATDSEKMEAFRILSEKHKDDLVFDMFVEQLATASIEGSGNTEALKEVKTYHNEIKAKRRKFEIDKANFLSGYKKIVIISFLIPIILAAGFGLDKYLQAFAWHPIGWIFGGVYIVLNLWNYKQLMMKMFDTNVMEVKV